MTNEQHSPIADRILQQVHTGSVRMHSRKYFIARLTLSIVVAVATLIVSAWVGSFIVFSLQEGGELFLLGYGARGIQTFFLLFPWILLSADVALIVFLEWLLQEFKLGYRVSLLTLLFYVFAGSVALGAVVNVSPIHSALLQKADRGELPLVGVMYEQVHDSHKDQGLFRGTVIASKGPTSTITHSDDDLDDDDGTHDILVSPSTKLDAPLEKGDKVYVFGTEKDGTIQAEGIRHYVEEEPDDD